MAYPFAALLRRGLLAFFLAASVLPWQAAVAVPLFEPLHAFALAPAYPSTKLTKGNDGHFYGTTFSGGSHDYGTIFRVTEAGELTVLFNFNDTDGKSPGGELLLADDGNFYGTATAGGSLGYGTAFRMTPAGQLTTLAHFDSFNTGRYPVGALARGSDGNFYGTTWYGGRYSNGTVFRMTPEGSLTSLAGFTSSDGDYPSGGLLLGDDGSFYGTTQGGGTKNCGTIFRVTLAGALTTLFHFSYEIGVGPASGLVRGNDGNFYGTTNSGGDRAGKKGTVFRITPAGELVTLATFEISDQTPHGDSPLAGLVLGEDGNFYGTTESGGENGSGTMFRMSPGGELTTLHHFQRTLGSPTTGLVTGSDGQLYGVTPQGGIDSRGTVYRISTSGEFTLLVQFNSPKGSGITGTLVQGSDGSFYGTTRNGGSSGQGTLFRMERSGEVSTVIDFDAENGSRPQGGIIKGSDGNIYGTTWKTVFRMAPDGTLTTLALFPDYQRPASYARLVQGGDGHLYGTTTSGGNGTVFRVTSEGDFTILVQFDTANGRTPEAGLTRGPGGDFYGTTYDGGSEDKGTVFRMTPEGNLTTLVHFNTANGRAPKGTLLSGTDGNLYGTTVYGGSKDKGTVFRMTPEGALTTLVHFNQTNGQSPIAGLTAAGDGNFYGTTAGGGVSAKGTVFRMTPSGTLTTVFHFDHDNGTSPNGGLIPGDDGHLYGATFSGGSGQDGQPGGGGQIFRVRLSSSVSTLPASPVAAESATLHTLVRPAGFAAEATFDYGTDPELTTHSTVPAGTTGTGTGTAAEPATAHLTDLLPGTPYYYRATVRNAGHPLPETGDILSFVTSAAPGNLAPAFPGHSATVPSEISSAFSLTEILQDAEDPDGDTLTLTAVGPSAAGAVVTLGSIVLTYSPPTGFSGTDTFPVTVTDNRGAWVTGNVTVTVEEENGTGNIPPLPVLTLLSGGSVSIVFQGVPGQACVIQRSTDLHNWTTLATESADPAGMLSHIDESPPPGQAFYRVRNP